MTPKEQLARALYYTYADLRYEPTKEHIVHWWELSDRERDGWDQVAGIVIAMLSAKGTNKP